jgi:hypothetical protein
MIHFPTSKRDQKQDRKVVGLFTLAMFLLLLIFAPSQTWANALYVQHDLPKPAPSPETSQVEPLEFGIQKTPSLTHKTPNLSPGNQDSLGFFLDKNRQGLGLQWEPGGKIPGVDLGLESHNLYSLNRMLPREGPYPNWTPQDDSQYFGNSRTAPDHSGAFLRFRW